MTYNYPPSFHSLFVHFSLFCIPTQGHLLYLQYCAVPPECCLSYTGGGIWTWWWLNDQLQDTRLSTPFTCLYAYWQMVASISQSAGITPASLWLLRCPEVFCKFGRREDLLQCRCRRWPEWNWRWCGKPLCLSLSTLLVTSKQKHVYLCFLIWMNLKVAVMSGFVSESPRLFEPDTDGDGTHDFWHHSFSFPTTHTDTLNEKWGISHLVGWSSSLKFTFQSNLSWFDSPPPPTHTLLNGPEERLRAKGQWHNTHFISFLGLFNLSAQIYDGGLLRASQTWHDFDWLHKHEFTCV